MSFAAFAPLPADADEALAPYEPSPSSPWDARHAAHLLRRAGFGGSGDEVRRALALGPVAAAAELASPPSDDDLADLDASIQSLVDFDEPRNLRAWWALRMARTRAPLRDKLALFFHGHFASGVRKVQSVRAMHAQCRLFLDGGFGSFRDLARSVARDAAMLVYLDGAKSLRSRPNENFARELMELFTLGRGAYGERDVREAARAFTGWRVDRGRAHFHAPSHDEGPKSVLGRSGPLGGDEVVDACIEHPACAPFLARKLLVFFVLPEPSDAMVAAFARRIVAAEFRMAPPLRELFASRAFHSSAAYRANVKSPVDYGIGALRALGGRASGGELATALSEMGQTLFEPPSVKGWEGGLGWIHSATWIARANFAREVVRSGGGLDREFDAAAWCDPEKTGDPRSCVDRALEVLVQGDVAPGVRDALLRSLERDGCSPPQLRSLLHAVLTLPEYHAA